jgi:DNA-binding MarR family transcriptional regulator
MNNQTARRVADELGPRLSSATIFFHETVSGLLGLNATDTKCLGLLSRSAKPMTAGDLAVATGLTTGAVTAIIDRLERAGLVCRKRDRKDRRKVFVELQQERMKDLAPLYAGLRRSIEALVAKYKEAELALIGDFLERAAAVLEHEARRLSRK